MAEQVCKPNQVEADWLTGVKLNSVVHIGSRFCQLKAGAQDHHQQHSSSWPQLNSTRFNSARNGVIIFCFFIIGNYNFFFLKEIQMPENFLYSLLWQSLSKFFPRLSIYKVRDFVSHTCSRDAGPSLAKPSQFNKTTQLTVGM